MIKLDFTNGTLQWAPQAAAGVDVTTRVFFGLTMGEWFYVSVIIYTLVQTACLVHKTRKGIKEDK